MEESTESNLLSRLPEELIIEVLSRLPVKTLLRIRCVCKFWRNLVTSDRVFIRCHLQNSVKKNNSRDMIRNVYIENGEGPVLRHKEPHHRLNKELIEKLEFDSDYDDSQSCRLIFRQGKMVLAGCCDGILCLVKTWAGSRSELHRHPEIYLCNPALHEFRALPRGHYHCISYDHNTSVRIFHDDDDYKVVRIIHDKRSLKVEIYRLSSNDWDPYPSEIFYPGGPIVSFAPYESDATVHNGLVCYRTGQLASPFVLNVIDINQKTIREIPLPAPWITEMPRILFPVWGFVFGSLGTSVVFLMICVLKEERTGISLTAEHLFKDMAVFDKLPSCRSTASAKHLVAFNTRRHIVLYDFKNKKVERTNIRVSYNVIYEYVVADFVASLVSVATPVHERIKHGQITNSRSRVAIPLIQRILSCLSRMFSCLICK